MFDRTVPHSEDESDHPDFEEIEAAYLRALEVADAVESSVGPIPAGEEEARDDRAAAPPAAAPARAGFPGREHEESAGNALLSGTQVLEALLFVGGGPLPGRKLAELLGRDVSAMEVEERLEQLNQRYAEQGRPYEVRLIEGGHEMALRREFEPVRSRVYGQGPKEVKLSQDVLEILAFVAYRQPVTMADVVDTGKRNATSHLRQLLRRQLIELHRGDEETYRTTPRFLQLFGLGDLRDLPRAVDFEFK